MMGKALTVILLAVLLVGGFAVIWSMELASGKAEDAAKMAALERKVKRLEALRAALEGDGEISFIGGASEGVPIIKRIEKLEKRVDGLEEEQNKPSGSNPKVTFFSGPDDPEVLGAQADPKKAPQPADSGGSALQELAEQDREHIKDAIREVISEEKEKQKLEEYEAERDKYRRQIVDQLRKVAQQLKLTDFQRDALQGLVDDMFAQLDRAAEDARFENNPGLIDEAKARLGKELSARAIELLDAEQLEMVKKMREERNKPKPQAPPRKQ
ncbi:MAG: hypothetical protein E3J72_13225 [Planctomycetota bacterium]|nr:MAG: hypothetical protein E3J72_13225 [Planctomycetota bacterium]